LSGIVIIDSGGANLASLRYALQRLGVEATISAEPAVIGAAGRVLLPGVGSAGDAMARLQARGLHELLPSLTQPVLGICLGMQLLFDRSEENNATCLGIIPGAVRKLQAEAGRPVPHMGWNTLQPLCTDPLFAGLTSADYVYFVHSYFAPPAACTLASTDYGVALSAVVRKANFAGVQFHPERSGAPGARLLQNFLADGN
jgi:glutamine amidotransferase